MEMRPRRRSLNASERQKSRVYVLVVWSVRMLEVSMRNSFLRTGGTAALAVLVLCASQPAAQARDGIGVGGAAALGVLGGVVAGNKRSSTR